MDDEFDTPRVDDSREKRTKDIDGIESVLDEKWGDMQASNRKADYGMMEQGDLLKFQSKEGYSEPLALFDTHPNRRFALGDRVVYAGSAGYNESMDVTGTVIGHIAEDRVMVRWPRIAAQADVDDLLRLDETQIGAANFLTDSVDPMPVNVHERSQMIARRRQADHWNFEPDVPTSESDIPAIDEMEEHGVKDPQAWAQNPTARRANVINSEEPSLNPEFDFSDSVDEVPSQAKPDAWGSDGYDLAYPADASTEPVQKPRGASKAKIASIARKVMVSGVDTATFLIKINRPLTAFERQHVASVLRGWGYPEKAAVMAKHVKLNTAANGSDIAPIHKTLEDMAWGQSHSDFKETGGGRDLWLHLAGLAAEEHGQGHLEPQHILDQIPEGSDLHQYYSETGEQFD